MQSQVYGTEEKNLTRLSCIHRNVTTKVFLFVFQKGSPGRSKYSTLLDYYNAEGILNFKKGLSAPQRGRIQNDCEGETFDITLLYKCLRNGSHGLAKDEESWKAQQIDIAGIESLITIAKNKRNDLAHGEKLSYTNEELFEEAQETKDVLTRILRFSGQIYSLDQEIIDREIVDVEREILKYLYGEFEAKTFEEYKKELFFEAQSELVNDEGVKEMLKQYDMAFENEISTVNHLVELKLPLCEVYTEMKLIEGLSSGEEAAVSYKDVLCDKSSRKTNEIIVIDGEAGVGKTTLTKKIVHDWRVRESNMKYLDTYDILLKSECRNSAIKSFEDLLYHLMPRISKIFKPGDLKNVVLAQRVLVILDGLDELNMSSDNLLKEILDFRIHFGITLLITTRPEKLNFLKQRVSSNQLKHIQLLGIPLDRRDEFITGYYVQITKKYQHTQDLQGLLEYLKRTEHILADLWRLPYNLSLLSILWAFDHMNVLKINTAPELYSEIFRLYKTKLKKRLQDSTPADESLLSRKVDLFLYSLSKESLRGLMNDHINLPQQAYERLKEVCINIQVPIEEMISAFLRRVPSEDVIYSFPHKGLQDFLAALYIFLEITGDDHLYEIDDIMEAVTACLIEKKVSPKVSHTIIRTVKDEITNRQISKRGGFRTAVKSMLQPLLGFRTQVIRNLLDDIHGSSQYELGKFQNMLFCLFGMFSSEKAQIGEDVKLEALELLQSTGMTSRDSWIRILNSVKCDKHTAAFISKQNKVFIGNIQITDSSVSAYIALLKALKTPLKDASTVKIDINIKGELVGAHDLFSLINSFQMKIKKLLITEKNYMEYTYMLKQLSSSLKDENEIEVHIIADEDLNKISNLLSEVRKRNFKVRKIKLCNLEVLDSNVVEYVRTLKLLPELSPQANQCSAKIGITGDLTGGDELLELFACHHFKVKELLVNENNFEKYMTQLEKMTKSLRDKRNLEIVLRIDEDLRNLIPLMTLIKKNHFQISVFKVRDIKIDDPSLNEYVETFKKMPALLDHANKTCIDIKIYEDLKGNNDLLDLISLNQFIVKQFLVTEHNFNTYTAMLEGITRTFTTSGNVEMHLDIDKDITAISRLIIEIRKKDFSIRSFHIRDITIDDSNITLCVHILRALSPQCRNDDKPSVNIAISYDGTVTDDLFRLIGIHEISVKNIFITDSNLKSCLNLLAQLKHLPEYKSNVRMNLQVNAASLLSKQNLLTEINNQEIDKNSFEGTVHVRISRKTSGIDVVLQQLARNKFRVNIELFSGFKNPPAPTVSNTILNVVFEECQVDKYMGRISRGLQLPLTLKSLWAGVPDNFAYIQLMDYLSDGHELQALSICVSLNLITSLIRPLPDNLKCLPSLYIPNVSTEGDVLKAFEIANMLTSSTRELAYVFFPRLKIKHGQDVRSFISKMGSLRIRDSIVLPSSQQIQLKEEITGLKIEWGMPVGGEPGTLADLDSWGPLAHPRPSRKLLKSPVKKENKAIQYMNDTKSEKGNKAIQYMDYTKIEKGNKAKQYVYLKSMK
ncbi:uncharacterized protein [Palaemon carinicauda]|uniref:uncharacterized protein isoform X2 n=1 Tax=Palaemon carinicauda TaxID=392227 RepID=UPI0035B62766